VSVWFGVPSNKLIGPSVFDINLTHGGRGHLNCLNACSRVLTILINFYTVFL